MRTFLFSFFILFVTGCSLPGTQIESSDTMTALYEGSGFSTLVPKSWELADKSNLPIPSKGSIALAYMSKDIKYGFSNNYVIMTDMVKMPVTSKKYSELNHIQTTKNYLEYTKLSEVPVTFPDSDTSIAYIFEARYNKTTPQMKFIQTAKVCGTQVFLLHISVSLDKSPEKYTELLQSFTCK